MLFFGRPTVSMDNHATSMNSDGAVDADQTALQRNFSFKSAELTDHPIYLNRQATSKPYRHRIGSSHPLKVGIDDEENTTILHNSDSDDNFIVIQDLPEEQPNDDGNSALMDLMENATLKKKVANYEFRLSSPTDFNHKLSYKQDQEQASKHGPSSIDASEYDYIIGDSDTDGLSSPFFVEDSPSPLFLSSRSHSPYQSAKNIDHPTKLQRTPSTDLHANLFDRDSSWPSLNHNGGNNQVLPKQLQRRTVVSRGRRGLGSKSSSSDSAPLGTPEFTTHPSRISPSRVFSSYPKTTNGILHESGISDKQDDSLILKHSGKSRLSPRQIYNEALKQQVFHKLPKEDKDRIFKGKLMKASSADSLFSNEH